MVSEPARGDNILDLFLASNHTLLNTTEILLGICDHDITFSNVSVLPKNKPTKNMISHYIKKKTDWVVLNLSGRKNLQKCWLTSKRVHLRNSGMLLKSALNFESEKLVPIKKISEKRSLPWIT